jgi:hypothetical protein
MEESGIVRSIGEKCHLQLMQQEMLLILQAQSRLAICQTCLLLLVLLQAAIRAIV